MHLADRIIALDSTGHVAQQGSWSSFQGKEDLCHSVLGVEDSTLRRLTTGTESKETKKPLPKALNKALKGPTANDIADLSRRTGDLALYKFYAASFGWKISLAMLASVAAATITTFFPRKLLYKTLLRRVQLTMGRNLVGIVYSWDSERCSCILCSLCHRCVVFSGGVLLINEVSPWSMPKPMPKTLITQIGSFSFA